MERSTLSIDTPRLFVIRHAQSANNALPVQERVSDPGLTPLGHLQAMQLACRFRAIPLQAIYCSAFLRSLETTRYLAAAQGLLPHVQWDLFEQGGCYAGFEEGAYLPQPGLGYSAIQLMYPGWRIDPRIAEEDWWARHPYESWTEAKQRAADLAHWLETLTHNLSGDIALVIHADFKSLLLTALLDDFTATMEPWNTSVTSLVRKEAGWEMEQFNATDHLVPELVT